MVPAWMEVQKSSIIVSRMCSILDGCEYYALMKSRLDVSAEALSQMIVVVSYHAGECECWAFLTSRSDISAEEELHGG